MLAHGPFFDEVVAQQNEIVAVVTRRELLQELEFAYLTSVMPPSRIDRQVTIFAARYVYSALSAANDINRQALRESHLVAPRIVNKPRRGRRALTKFTENFVPARLSGAFSRA